MRHFLLALTFAAAASIPVLLAPRDAAAQLSDSERQAARQLYSDGVALQSAGHFADALDKFTRAQKVVFAHTNLQHIGECQVQLGKWVEAEESYRLALRTDTGGNPAFQAAQDTSRQELAALEPRIPKVKIDVTPKDAPDLQVQLDGQAVNAALLDVPVPVDPGTHRIVVFAAGYSSAEQSITLQERDSKNVALTISPTGGVVYTSPNGTPVPPPAYTGQPAGVGSTAPPPPPPPAATGEGEARWVPPKPPKKDDGNGILLGVGLGVDIPSGDVSGGGTVNGVTSNNVPLSDYAKPGPAFGLSALLRFHKFGIGIFWQYSGYGQGDADSKLVSMTPSTETLSSNAHSNYFGAVLAYISNPQGVGFYGELGFGYRIVSHSDTLSLVSDSSQTFEVDDTLTSPELLLGAGVYVHAGPWLRVVPKLSIGLGSFGNDSASCTSSGGLGSCPPAQSSSSITNTSGHAFFVLGVNGYYEAPL